MKTKLLSGFLLIAIIVLLTNCSAAETLGCAADGGTPTEDGCYYPPAESSSELEKRLEEENDYNTEEEENYLVEDNEK